MDGARERLRDEPLLQSGKTVERCGKRRPNLRPFIGALMSLPYDRPCSTLVPPTVDCTGWGRFRKQS